MFNGEYIKPGKLGTGDKISLFNFNNILVINTHCE